MIFHINRATYKAGLSEEQRRAGLELLRQAGAANPAVKSYVVGPELGGEFEYGAGRGRSSRNLRDDFSRRPARGSQPAATRRQP